MRNPLVTFINKHNYDIRLSRNGRWIDQKCALDSVCFVADCIVNYLRKGGGQPFHSRDIWKSDYAVLYVQHIFGKPDPMRQTAVDEYNKFFRQPMKMLAAAGVLREGVARRPIQFSVRERGILEYIALRERNSFEFLCLYIEKTLRDSELWFDFELFLHKQTKGALRDLKNKFLDFCIEHTPINTTVEASRIFIKVLNPLACKYHKRGIIRGRLSPSMITYDKIMYNKTNWRDDAVGKDKNIARRDFIPGTENHQAYEYRVARAVKALRDFNDRYKGGKSEVLDRFSAAGEKATHIHHIFPKNEFEEIADYVENLIALTSGQHSQGAHPGGTSTIDIQYQYTCLIVKTANIKKNIMGGADEPLFYSFDGFMHVLDTGLQTSYFGALANNDFDSVLTGIEFNYPNS